MRGAAVREVQAKFDKMKFHCAIALLSERTNKKSPRRSPATLAKPPLAYPDVGPDYINPLVPPLSPLLFLPSSLCLSGLDQV